MVSLSASASHLTPGSFIRTMLSIFSPFVVVKQDVGEDSRYHLQLTGKLIFFSYLDVHF